MSLWRIIMRKFLVPLSALLLSAGVAVAAPFKDVPASHWAYDAIHKLSEKNIFEGVAPDKFAGNKSLSRFELAMTTARLLAHVEQAMLFEDGSSKLVTKADLETIERLKNEFSDELASIGLKVGNLDEELAALGEDVSVLKTEVAGIKAGMNDSVGEKVKLSGDLLVRHSNLIHKNDWALNNYVVPAGRPGNSNNVLTESQFRFRFTAQIDENITAVARWVMFAKNAENVNGGQSNRGGAFGIGGVGNMTVSDNVVNLAHLNINKLFGRPGQFTVGRVLYSSNHNLLLNNYLDVARYTRKVGDVDVLAQTIFDRHQGNYKDDGRVDFRPVVNLDLKTKVRDHNLYLGLFAQDDPALVNRRIANSFELKNGLPAAPFIGAQTEDKRRDVEFGAKGAIGKSAHWNYDLGLAYTDYSVDMYADALNPFIDVNMRGWQGLAAVGYDSKKSWAGKISYAFADDQSMGAISMVNDMRYVDFYETPTEDVGRGNGYFPFGLQNMYDLKIQAEYKPADCKHYARLACDILDELKDKPVNDLNRYRAGDGFANAVPVADKTNTIYDRTNNFGIADPRAMVLTGEYRYQLAKNTRIRLGYTMFDFGGDAVKGAASVAAGRGWNNDFDYTYVWSEILSKF